LNALRYGCLCSSAEVVQQLLEADPSAAMWVTRDQSTCLMMCADNDNSEEAVKIATLLLDAGCPVNAIDSLGGTALMDAACSSSATMVSLLIARGVIAVLCAAGADVLAPERKGFTAFMRALSRSKAIADAMVPFLPAGFKLQQLVRCDADPVGLATFAVEQGLAFLRNRFAAHVDQHFAFSNCWADLRLGLPVLLDDSEDDFFGFC
jgi:ankyrin repeat protein